MAIGRGPKAAGVIPGIATLLVLLVGQPADGPAASPKGEVTRQSLRDAERQKNEQAAIGKDAAERAERARAETERLASDRVAAAARLQQADAVTQDAAARIDALAAKQREAEQRLQAHAAAMQPLLPLIERLSLYPAETLLAVPAAPDTTLRGIVVLKGLAQQIEVEAEGLRRDQAGLDAASRALAAEVPRLVEAQAAQSREALALDEQIAAARAEQVAAEAEADRATRQAAAAAARTDTLRAALGVLEDQERVDAARDREAAGADRQKRTTEAPDARRREAMLARPHVAASITADATPTGQLQSPVVGVVVRGWGQATDGGPATGVSYYAPPAARVVAPCGGRVVFADAFRSYGLLLIIDCGGGYHIVMSGFDRLDVRVGQSIVAAEPVGVMPSWVPGTTARRPALSVELRRQGQPINPAPWLKPSG